MCKIDFAALSRTDPLGGAAPQIPRDIFEQKKIKGMIS